MEGRSPDVFPPEGTNVLVSPYSSDAVRSGRPDDHGAAGRGDNAASGSDVARRPPSLIPVVPVPGALPHEASASASASNLGAMSPKQLIDAKTGAPLVGFKAHSSASNRTGTGKLSPRSVGESSKNTSAVAAGRQMSPHHAPVEMAELVVDDAGSTDYSAAAAKRDSSQSDSESPVAPQEYGDPEQGGGDAQDLGMDEGDGAEAQGLIKYAAHLDNFAISLPSGMVMFLMMFACVMTVMGTAGSQFFGNTFHLTRRVVSPTQEEIIVVPSTVHMYLFKAYFVTKKDNERLFHHAYGTRDAVYTGPTETGTSNGLTTTFVLPDGTSNVANYCAAHNIPVAALFEEETFYNFGSCKGIVYRLHTAFAFGIIASFFTFCAGSAAFVRICLRTAASKLSVVLLCFVSLTFLSTTVGLSASVYDMELCRGLSFNQRGFNINFGLALLIASAGLSLISLIWALVTK